VQVYGGCAIAREIVVKKVMYVAGCHLKQYAERVAESGVTVNQNKIEKGKVFLKKKKMCPVANWAGGNRC
jgi:hypothetical protein